MSFIYIIHTASVCCNFFTVIICYIVIFLQYIIHIISILYETKHIHFPDKTPTPNVRPQPGRCKTSNKVKNLTRFTLWKPETDNEERKQKEKD